MARMGRWGWGAALALALIFLALLGWAFIERGRTAPTAGPAPDFTLSLYEGYDGGLGIREFRLREWRGRPVVINFWASWCKPCEEEAPLLEALWRKYRERGVIFVGVDYLDVPSAALDYLRRFEITYPNGPDLGTRISRLYRITGVPETFVVDPEGRVVFYKAAPIRPGELEAVLDPLVK
ncbi:MAG: TlpA family protein disulfide reductase [Thermoflexus hugenholtzii]|jgi:cytochrome c biogenesis protein CcmG/thiol:disulfide interchange protein DsbE|uniref:TlpA family protein disulfide reductase n=1 Tax=Thermoflexus TaxID=1495649 RepID=UPI001C75FC76|nr:MULTISPECIES: TlpA disulfide reductase family protein [Thermoflexus]QWK10978.1 MAG: TlpA family protein disulfide reductase [Thermoflexus hugenholtzii]